MAINFGILQPIDIAGKIAAGQQEAQRNQLAQQQMQTGALQQEKAQMDMAGFKRRQAGLDVFLQKSAEGGKTGSPEQQADSFYDFALTQEDPQLILAAQTMRQAAKERAAYNASRQPPKMSPTAPAPGALGSGTFGMDQPSVSLYSQPNIAGQQISLATSAPVRPQTPAASMTTAPMVNQLAPKPVAAAAPVNQLGADTTALENRIIDLQTNYPNVPQAQAEAARLTKQLDEARKLYAVGGNLVTGTGKPVFTAPEKPLAPPSSVAEFELAQADPKFMKFLQDRAAATRAPVQPVAPTITTVEDPNNPGKFLQVDARTYKGGGAGAAGVIGGARPSATAEKATAQRTQMGKDLGFAITQLADITKDGGLIDQSTGSGAGQLVDLGARFIGRPMPGDIAIGQIAPVADLVLKMVPRFEGPQSNADTKSYKEAAGQLADASLPTKIRKEAGKTVLRLMKERRNQFVTTDMAAEGTGAAEIAPPAGFVQDQR
jgi:hypothetical protein